MEIIVLKYTSYSKGNENTVFFTKEIGSNYESHNDLSFLEKEEGEVIVISFDFVNIVKEIPIKDNVLFLDIENLSKQLVGRSKKDYKKNNLPWTIWNMLKLLDPQDLGLKNEALEVNINNSKALFLGIHSELNISNTFIFLLNSIEKLYLNLKEELTLSTEKERYERIECKLNNILLKSTKQGIWVDVPKIKGYIEQINIELYEVKNKLQLEYEIFSLYDYENIKRNLYKDFQWFDQIKVNTKEFWKAISLRRNDSDVVNLLYLEKKLTKNKTILTRIGSFEENRVHLSFDYFGTVTGRILVNSPSLQQLSKKYRDVIIAEKGKELVYVDYCQFEAGILAHEANDNELIEMYNNNDIYIEISNAIGKENVSRDLAKKMFFCYCYGMSKNNILKYSGHDLNAFFNKFQNLEVFENKITREFKENGCIETLLGNRRYKSLDNKNNEKEAWIISQRIQGTASLVLKQAILNIDNKFKDIEFLLPMHDAVLYQVPMTMKEEYGIIIKEAFEDTLKSYLSNLNPKASIKNFYE